MNKKEEAVHKRNKPYFPADYLLAVADKLHRTNPTKAIIYNTIKDLYVGAWDAGYHRHIGDAKSFRDAMDAKIKESFDSIKDQIDDEIHNKSGN